MDIQKEEIELEATRIKETIIVNFERGLNLLKDFASKSSSEKMMNDFFVLAFQYNQYKEKEYKNFEKKEHDLNRCMSAILILINEVKDELTNQYLEKENKLYPFYNNWFRMKNYNTKKLILDNVEYIKSAICIFNYETYGKLIKERDSIEISDKNKQEFKEWIRKKRKFSKEELLNSTIIKISSIGTSHKVHLNKDLTLEESSTHIKYVDLTKRNNKQKFWDGSWGFDYGVFRMKVAEYDLFVLANKDNFVHLGVEFMGDKILLHEVFQIPFREKYSNYDWFE